jgi:O-antigen ligase
LTAIRAERNELPLDLVPSRWDLWRAALRMFHARPLLGIGPDNFRLLKWKYMDIPKGDDTILANSLYLEFLACSGLVGFLSLGWLLLELGLAVARRSAAALSPAEQQLAWFGVAFLASFLAHGTVDYFLKFTPTFLLFWIVMGVAAADAHRL